MELWENTVGILSEIDSSNSKRHNFFQCTESDI